MRKEPVSTFNFAMTSEIVIVAELFEDNRITLRNRMYDEQIELTPTALLAINVWLKKEITKKAKRKS